MKESRKEFIKKAHSAACSEWKENIEKEFPKLFKEDALVVGEWYKRKEDSRLWFVTHIKNGCSYGYGFDYSGYWADESKGFNFSLELNKATDKQAEQALIKEAKKIGYKNVKISNLESIGNMLLNHHSLISSDRYYYNVSENALWFMGRLIFWNGKWAKIVETITKEQAEKELGKTILN